MPPKKKGIAKLKKVATAASTRRGTRKKTTAASDDNDNDISNTAAPIRVNTDPSNRQRTRARIAAAKGSKDVSPILPVELEADPDAFAKKVAKGQTSIYADDKGQGEAELAELAEQKDTQGETFAAKGQQNSVEDVQHLKTRHLSVTATSRVATGKAPVDGDDDGIADFHKSCKENAEFLQSRPADRSNANKANNSLEQLHQTLWEDHSQRRGDAPLPPEFATHANALQEFCDPIKDESVERETRRNAIRWQGGIFDKTAESVTQYQQLLAEQTNRWRGDPVDLDGGRDAQRQHRAHVSPIDKLESPSAVRQSSVTLIVGHDSLVAGAASSARPLVMQACGEETSVQEAPTNERLSSQQAREMALPSIKQKLTSTARQTSVPGSKRERSSVDVGHEDSPKRQKSDGIEAASLENLLNNTQGDAAQSFGPPIAAGIVVPAATEHADVSAFRMGTDVERRPSTKVMIDRSESEDNDGTQSLFGDSDDGRDVAVVQQAAAAPSQPFASPTAVELQPVATTPDLVVSPCAVGRSQTLYSNVAPTAGGSPFVRKGLALPPMTPTQQTPPTSSPSMTSAHTSLSRHTLVATLGPQVMPHPSRASSRSASRRSSATLPALVDQSFSTGAEQPCIAPPTTSAGDGNDLILSRRCPNNPELLNSAVEYANKRSPEFVDRVEDKIRSPSVIIDHDEAEQKRAPLLDFNGIGPFIIDIMPGRRVGQGEDDKQRQMAPAPAPAPAPRSLNELLRATYTAQVNDGEEAWIDRDVAERSEEEQEYYGHDGDYDDDGDDSEGLYN
ncbi:hypothetical protein DOTSEDRAFT_28726 [Dothistroma septosporum NZE10]|uniref:Uncharacterized protein n=1 Tax=Dothistroma septosporum (strain NZE10 / CBS 128990) TaxID=675120 RepID=M2YL49_DOTSN|nr:hypothetical protein DOTSEDRAFT_28726 [Dothistroma septosporum NZE10]